MSARTIDGDKDLIDHDEDAVTIVSDLSVAYRERLCHHMHFERGG